MNVLRNILGLCGVLVVIGCSDILNIDSYRFDREADSGATSTGTGGEGGNVPQPECVTNDDCAKFDSACLVYTCLLNACFASKRDDDGDGYSLCGGGEPGSFDCNDNDPNIYPGASEVCGDFVDNDCNGLKDDGCFDFCAPFPDASGAGKEWWGSCCEVNGTFKQPQTAVPQPFEIVKADSGNGNGIYYVGSDGRRHLFPLMKIFASWYGKQDAQGIPAMDPSICGLITHYPVDTIAAIQLGDDVTLRPFTFITGLEALPDRWISAPGQKLRKMATGVAEMLFPVGSIAQRTWLTPDAFFLDYDFGTDVNSPADYNVPAAQNITLEQDLGLAP